MAKLVPDYPQYDDFDEFLPWFAALMEKIPENLCEKSQLMVKMALYEIYEVGSSTGWSTSKENSRANLQWAMGRMGDT